MLSFETALSTVLQNALPAGCESVALGDSLHRILAEDIFSDIDMPPFDKSAMDGFACRREDIIVAGKQLNMTQLRCIETIPAGSKPEKTIGAGECARIMTGAMVPPGADCVIMVEDTDEPDPGLIRMIRGAVSNNICYRGEDIRMGDKVLARGTQIGAAHIAVLASVGGVNPLVSKMPRVAIISTGDELVEPDEKPGPASIRNSNAAQLIAQVKQVPAIPQYMGIARDNPQSLREMINQALESNDLLLLSGGVSMGEHDYVPQVMAECGISILCKSVAIQPGRPTVFGRKGDQFVFGLPGNPVSTFVLFEVMVKPFLKKMMGSETTPITLTLPLGVDFTRRNATRRSLIPAGIHCGEAIPLNYHGSAHIHAYTEASAIITIDPGVTVKNKGEFVDVRLL